MAHFAKINDQNIVETVIVAEQDFIDSGAVGDPSKWIQTSYNTHGGIHIGGREPLRKNYAGIGYTYDPVRDAFIPPKLFQSWVLDEDSCTWKAPFQPPNDRKHYYWNEVEQAWLENTALPIVIAANEGQ